MADTENTEIVEEEQPQQQDPSLSLEELGVLLNVVDLAVQRGAFRGNEASQVGAIFDKLSSFLGAVQAAQQANAEGEAPAEAEQSVEAPADEPVQAPEEDNGE